MNIEKIYIAYQEHYLVDTDTRSIRKNTMFFALRGVNFNGNVFAAEAIAKGAAYAVVDEEKYATAPNIFHVSDVLATLQALAKHHRNVLGIPIVALTGSNGKTTSKELIHAVLRKKYVVVATKGNLNNHIGVPLTLLSMCPTTEIAVVEMGANHPKEIAFLSDLVQPDYGYITNFGKAHLEGFGSLEGVVRAKSELYDYLRKNHKIAIVNPEDAKQVARTKEINRIFFSSDIIYKTAKPFVQLTFNDHLITSQLIGGYNYTNIAAAITIGVTFEVPEPSICSAISNYVPTNNRSQIIKKDSLTIILDAYNANPTSMQHALDSFAVQEAANKLVIFGDMFELGSDSAQEHQDLAEKILAYKLKDSILVGTHFSKVSSPLQKFPNTEALMVYLKSKHYSNRSILIKGSRGMALEKLVSFL
ncbi:UDP-N-acetylmuramoyl-tripeptide--D-alanyl-D-alanine ligase [Tenacibaculum sp. SG-28]|uniref:UDP-N-acetylmuramoyl-tripeptide--D-alanyl-D- alanine ligase n=1 Tax=Tenacibaculum sp. SG-28 TaxID=754426 RepID=UPI000CF54AFF|nr:UDP-N-acetylmuramoyl-tripeptide--D-alanyl-D-alanine ligase [Tenacibaculum sp. SG-28]PQJ21077.1 UDP-N-acetylmuramoyl-tripeptide--D-alanyl-D-alanine ligase [Tenacibaculum sp. SG-28]